MESAPLFVEHHQCSQVKEFWMYFINHVKNIFSQFELMFIDGESYDHIFTFNISNFWKLFILLLINIRTLKWTIKIVKIFQPQKLVFIASWGMNQKYVFNSVVLDIRRIKILIKVVLCLIFHAKMCSNILVRHYLALCIPLGYEIFFFKK